MHSRIIDILNRMKPRGRIDDLSVQMQNMAELLSLLAEEQAESMAKMEKQTKKLVGLTRMLVILTIGLLAYTAVLCLLTLKLVQ